MTNVTTSARVNDLFYVAHAVTDLAAERKFYGETWGLTEVGEEDGMIYFAAEGSKGMHMGFGADYRPERVIREIITPWLLKRLDQHASA